MRDIPTLNFNVVHLRFEEQRLPSLKSEKVDSHNPVLCKSHTCTLLSAEANLQSDRVTSLYECTID